MTSQHDQTALASLYLEKARIAETFQSYGLGCDTLDRDALLAVFADDASASYDGETWMDGSTVIVDWLLGALGGLSYSQHMVTAVKVTVDGESAQAIAYLNAHQCAAADPATLLSMNGRYDCDLRLRDGDWRIVRLALTVGWVESRNPSLSVAP